jgi:magnesium chelatase family protein
MSGTPGSGKTLLARSIIGLLPPLSRTEAIEVAKIYSSVGLLRGPLNSLSRPFCSPHHTASPASIVGGGTIPRPGQVTLAHRGVLFLDELPEFARNVLEALRQPLEDGLISISRAASSLVLPAKFMLVGAMNPCPCGNFGDPGAICVCPSTAISRYGKKISGPLLDRLDIQVQVSRERISDETSSPENIDSIRQAIAEARQLQLARFAGTDLITNSEINHKNIDKYCIVSPEAEVLLRSIINKKNLSLRAYHRIKKIARTIADLESSPAISSSHVAEALALRISDRVN